jgi:hypothetical protein
MRKSIIALAVWVSFLIGMVVWGNTLQLSIMNGGPVLPQSWTLPGFNRTGLTVYGDHPYMVLRENRYQAERQPFTAYRIRDGPHICTPS